MPLPLKSAVTDDPESISLEPDSFVDDFWTLEFDTDHRGPVKIALSPGALDELHLQVRTVPTAARGGGPSEECDICGGQVDLFLAIPNTLGRPVHRECYSEAYNVGWVSEYP